MSLNTQLGFGCPITANKHSDYTSKASMKVNIAVYIANKPTMQEYQNISTLLPLAKGEINAIAQACGNGWRKVFNVYAKVLFALDEAIFPYQEMSKSWQKYRDDYLLQKGCTARLLFSPPALTSSEKTLHIICGRTYANTLLKEGKLSSNLIWLDEEFAIDHTSRLVVCPYFDYRQLSNIKIERLAVMLKSLI